MSMTRWNELQGSTKINDLQVQTAILFKMQMKDEGLIVACQKSRK